MPDLRPVADVLHGQGDFEVARVDEFELGRATVVAADLRLHVRFRRLVDLGQARFEVTQEARHDIRFAALDFADGLEQARLFLVAACAVCLLEQPLLDLVEQQR